MRPSCFLLFATLVFMLMPNLVTAAELVVPLEKKSWVVLSYNKIPPNKVNFNSDGILIEVVKSAGPVVYKFEQPKKISGFNIKGRVKGQKKIESVPFDEDSILRFGLVATGKQTLTGPKKLFAADWVKKLFALVPEGSGLDKIYFYNVTNRKELVTKRRIHPKSDLMIEEVVLQVTDEGAFQLDKVLTSAQEIAAVWISTDGDDSASEFATTISEIKLKFD